ncbi:related to OTU domain-containing protein 6B [Phialocephala subalpina]|uniref:Related to OTU domain-containing protein 6B n=1 Tax=Phialocephala subalpina TaxID=576137 RepID=A0A1L7X413_9HELO|nr:related to OTU domain-containing protein 6B [Phialocephala subalpina]
MESLEEMQSRHRKEQKDLQSRVTQKKKNTSKKTRKGVNTECEELERQLKERQAQELSALNGESLEPPELEADESANEESADTAQGNDVNGVADSLASNSIFEPAESENGDGKAGGGKKRNRAKERLARRAAETAAAVEEAKVEAQNQPDIKALERKKISSQFESHGLVEQMIRPDGHCLFNAVADQLQMAGIPLADDGGEVERYKTVRVRAAKYMEEHVDEFDGFLEEPLHVHVRNIRDTAEWGGHLELLALSRVYGVDICVLQDGPMQTIEPGEGYEKKGKEGKEKEKIWLAYYRHGFGLGEHYNSLRKVSSKVAP